MTLERAWRQVAFEQGKHIAALEAQLTAANDHAERYKAALEKIAEEATRRTEDESAICLRCGMETFGRLEAGIQHEKDCVQQFAQALLNLIPTSDTGENDG